MKVLSTNKEIEKTLLKQLNECDYFSIATAWASAKIGFFENLLRQINKIKYIVVGMHFYQTDPIFIESLMNEKGFRVVKDLKGVFHPKVYLFVKGSSWDVVIGSPNLTHAALTVNKEIAVHVSGQSLTDNTFQELNKVIKTYWDEAEVADYNFIESYKIHYKKRFKFRKRLMGDYSSDEKNPRRELSPLKTDIFNIPWERFVSRVKKDKQHKLSDRISVLNGAHELFKKKKFNEMSDTERKKIGGVYYGLEDGFDWRLFGSMKGAGLFAQAVGKNAEGFSFALDEIPLDGEITEDNLNRFMYYFSKAFGAEKPLATATRLLAMKRPDYFFCMASANMKMFCEEFQVKASKISIENYWAEVVLRIQDCSWWNADKPTTELELNIWNGRAAFLDSIYYQPKK